MDRQSKTQSKDTFRTIANIKICGDVYKCESTTRRNYLKLKPLHHFSDMSKKFVFSVVVKSRKKLVFFEANNVINVMFADVNFH